MTDEGKSVLNLTEQLPYTLILFMADVIDTRNSKNSNQLTSNGTISITENCVYFRI